MGRWRITEQVVPGVGGAVLGDFAERAPGVDGVAALLQYVDLLVRRGAAVHELRGTGGRVAAHRASLAKRGGRPRRAEHQRAREDTHPGGKLPAAQVTHCTSMQASMCARGWHAEKAQHKGRATSRSSRIITLS
jgi:hypothetical protein